MRRELINMINDKLPSLARSQYNNEEFAHFSCDKDSWDYDQELGLITYQYTLRKIPNGKTWYDLVVGLKANDLDNEVKKLEPKRMFFNISYSGLLAALFDEV